MPVKEIFDGQTENKGNLTGDETNNWEVTLGVKDITYGTTRIDKIKSK
jgi:hypothetical protein